MLTACSLICYLTPAACSVRHIAAPQDSWSSKTEEFLCFPRQWWSSFSFMLGCKTLNMLTPGLALLLSSVSCCSKAKCDLMLTLFHLFWKSPCVFMWFWSVWFVQIDVSLLQHLAKIEALRIWSWWLQPAGPEAQPESIRADLMLCGVYPYIMTTCVKVCVVLS